ncbi:hypothetical protein [Sorangium sp. So ce426]
MTDDRGERRGEDAGAATTLRAGSSPMSLMAVSPSALKSRTRVELVDVTQ